MFEVGVFTAFEIKIEYISLENNLFERQNSSTFDIAMILIYVVSVKVNVFNNYFFPSSRNFMF